MEEIMDRLFYMLFFRGFTPRESLLLVEDVAHIVSRRNEITPRLIKIDLEKRGWHKPNVDPLTVELIIEFLESHSKYEARRLATH